MLKIRSLIILSAAAFALSSCSASVSDDVTVGVAEQPVLAACLASDAPKWRFLANMAVAVAQEMGSLDVTQQFMGVAWNGTTKVALTPYGESFCAISGCPKVRGFLALQEQPSNLKMVGSSYVLDIAVYRTTMAVNLGWAKANVDQSAASGDFSRVPEDNKVTFVGPPSGVSQCGNPFAYFDVRRDFHLTYSYAGPIANKVCVGLSEPADPDGWSDNYLCSERNLGLKWSYAGPIPGMYCTSFNESADPYGWGDNYLCAPENYGLTFHTAGPPSTPGTKCIAITEGADPHTWNDNYLCWNTGALLNHPSSLDLEMYMFGSTMNPFLDFSAISNSQIRIDPTDYNSGTIATGSTGSCVTSLPYYSPGASVAGGCCFVASTSTYGALTKYPLKAYTYYCKTT